MDKNIQISKHLMHRWEGYANRYGEELKQLESTIKDEGLFCVELCLVVSVGTINYEGFIVKFYTVQLNCTKTTVYVLI